MERQFLVGEIEYRIIDPGRLLNDERLQIVSTQILSILEPPLTNTLTFHILITEEAPIKTQVQHTIHIKPSFVGHFVTASHSDHDETLGILTYDVVSSLASQSLVGASGDIINAISEYTRFKTDLAPPHWANGTGDWKNGGIDAARLIEFLIRQQPNLLSEWLKNGRVGMSDEDLNQAWELLALSTPIETRGRDEVPDGGEWKQIQIAYILGALEGSELITRLLPDPQRTLGELVMLTLQTLYKGSNRVPDRVFTTISFVFKDMPGVAHTIGTEISFSIPYFLQYFKSHTEQETLLELKGVVVHETTHVIQHSTPTTPWHIIEGMADYTRIATGFIAPHWSNSKGGKWTDGYSTTGYFLVWMNLRNPGCVRELNWKCRNGWTDGFVRELCGSLVDMLWQEYQATLPDGSSAPKPVPTHVAGI
ncbi:hypothetical protein SmJEL517_g01557 [Synchytrium microbalum]|uniref:Uncharacterized protein n=1 Tax=Synchytrium microbalum TaxID=1806994 RepID=A0A507C4A5_9FUNG|nr:uncharacterized protein SmJEL517_g01557 [Synchytrium microbalum]TPX36370.1 hypothetical protein SmJEL517_g01557 [Synchytrium microbalum]